MAIKAAKLKRMGGTAPADDSAPKAPRDKKEIVTYTLRTVPRPVWEKFTGRLDKGGHSINWALNKFIAQYGNGTLDLAE